MQPSPHVRKEDSNGLRFAKDPDGTVWTCEFLFAENEFGMDHEHGLPNAKRGLLLCKHCLANTSYYPFHDSTPTAKWKDHMVKDNSAFMQRVVRRHPLADCKCFNRYTVRNNLMHCMYHHGVYGIIFASIVPFII